VSSIISSLTLSSYLRFR